MECLQIGQHSCINQSAGSCQPDLHTENSDEPQVLYLRQQTKDVTLESPVHDTENSDEPQVLYLRQQTTDVPLITPAKIQNSKYLLLHCYKFEAGILRCPHFGGYPPISVR